MGLAQTYMVSWFYPVLQYSFPDEESFKVDIINETGYWFWPGQKVTQIFELNGVNVHQSKFFSLNDKIERNSDIGVTTQFAPLFQPTGNLVLLSQSPLNLCHYSFSAEIAPFFIITRIYSVLV